MIMEELIKILKNKNSKEVYHLFEKLREQEEALHEIFYYLYHIDTFNKKNLYLVGKKTKYKKISSLDGYEGIAKEEIINFVTKNGNKINNIFSAGKFFAEKDKKVYLMINSEIVGRTVRRYKKMDKGFNFFLREEIKEAIETNYSEYVDLAELAKSTILVYLMVYNNWKKFQLENFLIDVLDLDIKKSKTSKLKKRAIRL